VHVHVVGELALPAQEPAVLAAGQLAADVPLALAGAGPRPKALGRGHVASPVPAASATASTMFW
jgi:hypothetical protein